MLLASAVLPAWLRGRRQRLIAGVLGLCALGLLGRDLVVRSSLGAASEMGVLLAGWGEAQAERSAEQSEEDAELPEASAPALNEAAVAELDEPTSAKDGGSTPRQRVYAEKRVDVGVSAEQVLAFANAHQVPRGVPVSAHGGCPAGIRLRNVAGLGLGVADGDLLVQVNGAPVTDRSEVVSLVLAARGRKERSTQALVLRPSTRCRQGYRVSVEQPYPSDAYPTEDEGSGVGLTPPVSSLEGPSKGETSYGQNRSLREARP